MPLIFAAALLSFAHGSNDVANAIGPLAGFYDALTQNSVHARAAIPMWTLVLGALGLGVGLILFGPKVIRTIGSELTGLDAMRAYCIAMAATVIFRRRTSRSTQPLAGSRPGRPLLEHDKGAPLPRGLK